MPHHTYSASQGPLRSRQSEVCVDDKGCIVYQKKYERNVESRNISSTSDLCHTNNVDLKVVFKGIFFWSFRKNENVYSRHPLNIWMWKLKYKTWIILGNHNSFVKRMTKMWWRVKGKDIFSDYYSVLNQLPNTLDWTHIGATNTAHYPHWLCFNFVLWLFIAF